MKKYFGRIRREARRTRAARTRRRFTAYDQLEARCLLSATPFDTDQHLDHPTRDAVGYEFHALTTLPGAQAELASSNGPTGNTWDAIDASKTFLLHSNPGARHTIYLDFDGHRTSGTPWNSSFNGGADIVTPAYDFDGNKLSFSTIELERIQRIWQRVAEDFLPFDVDVTTQDPGAARLIKSGTSDSQWGVRVVIGGDSSDWLKASAGGIAYLDSFNWTTDTPAFVFEDDLGNGHEKYVAEAISHEAGHTLGLRHDGSSSAGYYTGHGSGATGWAPIMGAGYYRETTQWSRGEYTGANNKEDDLAIITTRNGFSYRADDFGNDATSAANLLADGTAVFTTGVLERANDVDVFSFHVGDGTFDLTLSPALRGANVDLLAELYDASSTLVASVNPSDQLSAHLNVSVTAGRYYLHVSGVGRGAATTGYSDYGSLGGYQLQGELPPAAPAPSFVSIAAGDADKAEGNSSTTSFTFTVTRSGDTNSAAAVTWSVAGTTDHPVTADDFAGGVLPSGTVSFAAGETTKTISILVKDDGKEEASECFLVTLADATGAEIDTASAMGVIQNDDLHVEVAQARIIVTALKGYVTSEAGGRVRFSVVLSKAPTARVFIPIRSLDPTEGLTNKSELVFTPQNWNVPQYFNVRGIDDRAADGNVSYVLRIARSKSFDLRYNWLGPGNIALTNQDNETLHARWNQPSHSAIVDVAEPTTADWAAFPAVTTLLLDSATSPPLAATVHGNEASQADFLPAIAQAPKAAWLHAVDHVFEQPLEDVSRDDEFMQLLASREEPSTLFSALSAELD